MNMPMHVNLNADMGESFGAWIMGNDNALLDVITAANIACGFHAGDPLTLRNVTRKAAAKGISIGAHPAFPDLVGFGRRRMDLSPAELEAALIYQIGALQAMAHAAGTRLIHVKPHGAMNNMAAANLDMARIIAKTVAAIDPSLLLLAPAASQMIIAAQEIGLPVVEEIFADRAYQDDGQLVPRSHPDAMVHGAAASLLHVQRMLEERALVSLSGKRIPINPGSICVHGDGPDAVATAHALRSGLEAAGWHIVPLDKLSL